MNGNETSSKDLFDKSPNEYQCTRGYKQQEVRKSFSGSEHQT